MVSRLLHRFEKASSFRIGVVLLIALMLLGYALFQKTRIGTALERGDNVTVAFARDYQLRAYVTKVKIKGVPVGIVTGVEHEHDGTAVATLHLEKGVRERLRSTPTASIRPTTMLGGNYYVELQPGGDPGEARSIPAKRTTTPVELDRVLEVLKPNVRVSTQRTIDEFGRVLGKPGQRAVDDLTKTAPDVLPPTGRVLNSLRGTSPETDLANVVGGLEGTARALSADRGRLAGSLDGLSEVSAALARRSPQLASTIHQLPATLRTTRRGLDALGHTLDVVRDVSDDVRPTARELSGALRKLQPALRELRPVVRDLNPTLRDLRPVVTALVPTAADATTVLKDVNGPVIDRVRGPVVHVVNSPWHGTGDYAHDGSDTVFYKELGDMFAGMALSSAMTDRNGAAVHFQPGFGVGSISGVPIDFAQLLFQLFNPKGTS